MPRTRVRARTVAAGAVALVLAAALLVRLATHPLGRLAVVAVAVGAGGLVAAALARPAAYDRLRVGVGRRVLVRPVDDGRAAGAAGGATGDGDGTADASGSGPCASCGTAAVAGGERRRFVREAVVLGVPFVVLDDGTNVYCADCAADRDPVADAGLGVVEASTADVSVVRDER